jgi:periplasmic protein TonB
VSVMFEAFSQDHRITRGRWVGASMALHALLLVILWRVMIAPPPSPVRPPSQPVTFLAPPPPPPAGGEARPRPEPKVVRKRTPSQIVQPTPQPAPVKGQEPPEEPAGQVGGVAGGVAGGVVGGKIGEFDSSRMTPPRLLAGPEIRYTEKALENDVEGLMIVRCILTIGGEVRRCEVGQSVRFMDSTVVEALEKRRYTPVTLEGRPIEVYYTFKVRLKLPR